MRLPRLSSTRRLVERFGTAAASGGPSSATLVDARHRRGRLVSHALLMVGLLLLATELSAQTRSPERDARPPTAAVAAADEAQPKQGDGLRATYEKLAPQLARSPFQRPLLLRSLDNTERPTGEMHAVVSYPFETLKGSLQQVRAWCDLLTLPANVKRCSIADEDSATPRVRLAVGRKFDQPIEEAYALDFRFQLLAAQPQYLLVEMSAPQGPMGTSNYRLSLEAVPIDARRSFIRLRYAYVNGVAARMATSAYLATAGRDKVGFTITGKDSDGSPRYVGGIQGIAERNTMRYFLAIESYLATLRDPSDQRLDRRLRDWYTATERYARQLHEQSMDEYLTMKHREARQQVASN